MDRNTPCIAVCILDPDTGLCFGCGRTLPEIARWGRMDPEEQAALMAALPERMSEAGLVPPTPRPPTTGPQRS